MKHSILITVLFCAGLMVPAAGPAAELPSWLGIDTVDVEPVSAMMMRLKEPHGVILHTVKPGGAVDQAGLTANDAIIAVDGVDLTGGDHLQRLAAAVPPNESLECFALHIVSGPQEPIRFEPVVVRLRHPRPADPLVYLVDVQLEPPVVAAGELFTVRATYGVVDPAVENRLAEVNYKIVVLKDDRQQTLDTGMVTVEDTALTSTFEFRAPSKTGRYILHFILRYKDITRAKKMTFDIR